MNFKHYISSRFSTCRKLAEAHDNHRNRAVSIFMLPGHFDHVGVTDGVDSWVAPVCINPFSVDVRKMLADIQSGIEPVATPTHKSRVKVAVTAIPSTPVKKERVRVQA